MVAEILNNLPIPPTLRRGAQAKYPWLQLKPGQAFKFAPGLSYGSCRSMASATASAAAMVLVVRRMPDGIYCWRVDGMKNPPQSGNVIHDVPVIEQYDGAGKALETDVFGFKSREDDPI